MKLVKHTAINKVHFGRTAPTKQQWLELIESGAINGKLLGEMIFIDEDDFLSRDNFNLAANDDTTTTQQKVHALLG
ncbi:MAG: hypothetical protein ACI93R_003270 [Flavobacteriales bacterium]|jgi:hypothetical protein